MEHHNEGDDGRSFERAGRTVAHGGAPEGAGPYAALLDALPLPAGIFEWTGAQRLVHVNCAFNTLSGYSLEEIGTLGHWMELTYPDPEERRRLEERWSEFGTRRPFAGVHHRLRVRNGRVLDVKVTGVPLDGGLYLFVMRDVGAEIGAEAALRASEARFRKLLEALPEGVVAHDGGRVVFANPAAARMVGLASPEALVGEPVLRYVHPDCHALVARRVTRILSEHEDLELIREKFLTVDGQTLDVEVAATEVGFDDRELSMVVFRDISEKVRLENERRSEQESIRQAQRLESLSMLAGGVAHDFNNLLAGILGNTELALLDPDLPETARIRLRAVERVARHASDLAAQMQTLTGERVQQGVVLDVSALVCDIEDLLRATVPRTVGIEYDLASPLPTVDADPTQVRQVVVNLVTNATEAFGGSGGRITIRTRHGSYDSEALARCLLGDEATPGKYVVLEVEDDGAGMDESIQALAFEPFFSTKRPGRGLGLAAVLGIVRAHQGAIEVASEKGKGTRVRILLPARGGGPAERLRPELSTDPGPEAGRGLVLVVDDEPTVLEVASAMLQTAGYQVLPAMDGPGALKAFEDNRQYLCCILLDRNLPGMDGLDVYSSLRAADARIPVVFCSGYPRDAQVEAVVGDRRVPYLNKPFRYAELVGVVREAIENP